METRTKLSEAVKHPLSPTALHPMADLVGETISGRQAMELPSGSVVAWYRDANPATNGRFKTHDGTWFPAISRADRYRVLYVAQIPAPAREAGTA